ncbi:MAG: AAA family ATPase [Rickettsiales bacterium]|jgi:DNA polymerase-3 subunit delta'|nr:AAA family ATPase [Rickettsiales bacterium]
MAKKDAPSFDILQPMLRADLFGHADAEKTFLDAWNNREVRPLHPAWILTGAKGIGKATLAHRIARFIFANSQLSTLEIPADSPEFQRYADGGYSDLQILSLDTEPEEKASISVDSVRRMIDGLRMSASDGGWRVVIIDSIDDMNRNAANSLLKILEEPPAQTLFLIVAHKLSGVLPTIKSRSAVIRLRALPDADVRKLVFDIVGDGADLERVSRVASAAGGSVAKALSIMGSAADDFPDLFETARIISDPTAKSSRLLEISKHLSSSPDSMNILLDVIYNLSITPQSTLHTPHLSDLYFTAASELASQRALNLEADATAYKIIRDIRKCLLIPTAI